MENPVIYENATFPSIYRVILFSRCFHIPSFDQSIISGDGEQGVRIIDILRVLQKWVPVCEYIGPHMNSVYKLRFLKIIVENDSYMFDGGHEYLDLILNGQMYDRYALVRDIEAKKAEHTSP